LEDAEVQEKRATAEKTIAEAQLILEKINSERVEQAVKIAGVTFDEEKLAMERADLVKSMEKTEHDMKVDAEKVSVEKTKAAADKGNGDATKSANKKEQGPHIEKGLKSDNKRQ
jgi:hypothetical protein